MSGECDDCGHRVMDCCCDRREFWPALAFANYVGPAVTRFAWKPVRLWSGEWVWLRRVKRRVAVVHWHLTPGGGDCFWVHSNLNSPQETPDA